MKALTLFLALVCGAASFVLYSDSQFVRGGWAAQLCKSAGSFCHEPQELAYVAVGLLGLWLLMVFLTAIRD
jgi:hypothetical protein